jgi:cyclophilin family peptidyl-prolyl cis-trans isomerase
MKALFAVALLLAAALAGCADTSNTSTQSVASTGAATSTAPSPAPTCTGVVRPTTVPATHTVVALDTGKGCMVAELYDDKAPATVANFKQYVTEGFYSHREFYRIVRGFVNQAGGESQGDTGHHAAIKDEAKSSGLHNYQYTLAMARTDQAASATTEFYINAANNTAGHTTNLDPGGVSPDGYAVFGILVAGRDVSDGINQQTTVDLNSIMVLS